MDNFDTFMSGKNGVDEVNAKLRKKEQARVMANKLGVKPKDITIDMLDNAGVLNTREIMEGVCIWIQEFYGLSLWELRRTSQKELLNKYKLSQKELDTLLDYGDITLAYGEYVKTMLGEKPSESEETLLQTKTNVIVDEGATSAVMQKMHEDEKNRLQSLIDNETDPEKKELYEAQMKVLNLKEKNGWKN